MTDSAGVRDDRNRLRWQCRRGTLELDTVLMDFLDHVYHTLTVDERLAFERLLHQPDVILQAWLFGHQEVADRELKEIVTKIQ